MYHRLSLRALTVATVAAATVLVPVASASASDPTPRPSAPAERTPEPVRGDSGDSSERVTRTPRGGVAAGDKPTPAPARDRVTRTPRGGVAAGERPAGENGGSTALAGSAVAVALLAGAGTVVVRRRAHGNG
ncbi:hypothetical protein [Streptomyces sp. NPDC020681]|uniref:hypothetical protein n=1 Tax=Streptomyces sp. NPDC020681 TaxID=3365083 RepID=UPI00378C4EE9